MHQIHRALGAALTASAFLLTSACGSGGSEGAASAQPGQLKVVVAFYPFQYAAERVGGSDAKIENLTQPGAEPHDLELSPKQIASLSEADVVVYQKGFQPAVDKAIEEQKPKKVVDVATLIKLHEAAADEHGHDHGAEEPAKDGHGHDDHAKDAPAQEEKGHEGHDHDHGGLDPHGWLDPTNMATIATALGKSFGEAKPDKAQAFTQNAQAASADFTKLDESFTNGLKNCKRKEIFTSHDAFGYLAERYHLEQISVRGMSPDAEPSPARIAEVQALAKEHGVTTIFYEELASPAVSQAIAKDLGLKTDVLDPLEGLTDKSRGKNYLEVMQSNLKSLQAANECA